MIGFVWRYIMESLVCTTAPLIRCRLYLPTLESRLALCLAQINRHGRSHTETVLILVCKGLTFMSPFIFCHCVLGLDLHLLYVLNTWFLEVSTTL